MTENPSALVNSRQSASTRSEDFRCDVVLTDGAATRALMSIERVGTDSNGQIRARAPGSRSQIAYFTNGRVVVSANNEKLRDDMRVPLANLEAPAQLRFLGFRAESLWLSNESPFPLVKSPTKDALRLVVNFAELQSDAALCVVAAVLDRSTTPQGYSDALHERGWTCLQSIVSEAEPRIVVLLVAYDADERNIQREPRDDDFHIEPGFAFCCITLADESIATVHAADGTFFKELREDGDISWTNADAARDTCLFCSSTKTTDEHLFSDWMSDLLPKIKGKHQVLRSRFEASADRNEMKVHRAKRFRAAGDVASTTLKVVCSDCNNGWMSRIDSTVRDCLTPLILGERAALTSEEQVSIARWATLKTIIGEQLLPRRASISEARWIEFARTHSPIPHSQVFLGNYSGHRWGGKLHRLTSWHESEDKREDQGAPYHRSVSIFVFGRLFICCIITETPGIEERSLPDFFLWRARRIHPVASGSIEWPPSFSVRDRDLDRLSFELRYWLHGLRAPLPNSLLSISLVPAVDRP